MIRADVFDRLGGFDEAFWPAWWEDVDFCRRLRTAGHRIRYVPDAVFQHQGGASVEALGSRTFERVFAANRRRYVRKHHGRLAAAVDRRAGDRRRDDARRRPRRQARPLRPRKAPVSRKIGPRLAWSR